ncbi:ATP-binding protein [Streptomyces sp. NBC_00648]|uniref:ATP-binding protein n=1 Tax=Streptomyces sp. NBC_00648 TaxID=2975797 RepID=UPI00325532CF
MATWGYSTDAATLGVAELAANAVAHGSASSHDSLLHVAVHPDRPATVRVEVSDACADQHPQPHPCLPDNDAESGRGLVLVEALALAWGVASRPYGKTVWAVVALGWGFDVEDR